MTGLLKNTWKWLSDHGSALLWTFVAAVVLYVLAVAGWPERGPAFVLPMLAGLAVALHFGHCFTRDLPATQDRVSTELRWIFRYAYGFLGVALLASLSPFLAPKDIFTSSETWAGVVDGCLQAEAGYGSELTRCDDDGSDQQWVLHIGSWSTRAQAVDERALADLADAARAACTAPGGWARVGGEFEALGRTDGAALVEALQGACGAAGTGPGDMDAILREQDVAARDGNYLSRGLVVPLYVVVLAVFGGAVGMSRRVPEIQRGAAASAKQEDPEQAISAIEARERVVFQIMQVLSAPLIAITGFAAFEPDTMTAAVLIGFISGFASETILKKLRQAGEAVVGRPEKSEDGLPDASPTRSGPGGTTS